MIPKKVVLEPVAHVYHHVETGERYPSVTTFLGRFEKHFDADGVAAAIVRQREDRKNPKYAGKTKADILQMWQDENDAANEFGTMVHGVIEKYLVARTFYFPKDETEIKILEGWKKLNVDLGQEYYPEQVLYHEGFKLAGMSDLVIDIDDELFDIADWKTNKKFNYFSEYKQKMLYPVEHLEDCQHSVYSLQLSIYAYFYECLTSKKCRQLYVGYFNREDYSFSRIPLLYLKESVIKMLETIKD